MKKLFSILLLVAVVVVCAAVLPTEIEAASTSSLTFKSNGDGSYYVSDCYTLASGSLVIPSTYNGKPVTRIGYNAFWGCVYLTSITIPDSVTSIADSAFAYCDSLTSVTIGNGVTSIGGSAFSGCNKLTSVYIKDIAAWCAIDFSDSGSNPLSNNLYLNGKLVTNLVIPEGVTTIGDYAFAYCDSLTSITIPNSMTKIGDYAFNGCSNLTYNEYGNAKYLGNKTNPYIALIKAKSTNITSAVIHEDTKFIVKSAFDSCENMTSITLPFVGAAKDKNNGFLGYIFGASSYQEQASEVPSSLKDVVITGGKISNNAFSGCRLTSVTIGDGVTSIGDYAFYDCSLTSVTIGNGVTSIGDYAFYDCSFTSVTIGNGVTSIGKKAFYGCTALTSAVIPKSVVSIGEGAFEKCSNLTEVKYTGTDLEWDSVKKESCGIQENTLIFGNSDEIIFQVFWDSFPTYTGSELKPVPIVTRNNTKLYLNQDYTLTYKNNINAGTRAKVVITGIGRYSGLTMSAFFTILPADIANNANFQLSSVVYTTYPVYPQTIKVTNKNGALLKENVDYQIIYSNNILAGNAKARFIGMGNYTGYYDATFKITNGPDRITDNSEAEELVINLQSPSRLNGEQMESQTGKINFILPINNMPMFHRPAQALYVDGELYADWSNVATSQSERYLILPKGKHTIKYDYITYYKDWGPDGSAFIYEEKGSVTWVINVLDYAMPEVAERLGANTPIYQGTNTIYLGVNSYGKYTGIPLWKSSNPGVASVVDGIVTIHKAGNATITATVGKLTATWELEDIQAISLSKNASILNYDITSGKAKVVWKNELLTEGKDYTIIVRKVDDVITVIVSGINNYCGKIETAYFADTGYPYMEIIAVPGDIDGNETVSSDDVVQLLLHISMPDMFPIEAEADFTGDGKVTSDDVVQLLLHISMPDLFPLETTAPSRKKYV